MPDYNINTFARHVVTEQQDLHPSASGSFSWLLNGIEFACKIIGEEVRRLGLSMLPVRLAPSTCKTRSSKDSTSSPTRC